MKKEILILGLIFAFLLNLVCVTAITIKSVDISPGEIKPGGIAIVEIVIENNLKEDVEHVSVSLVFREVIKDSFGNIVLINEVPFAPFDSSNEETIAELDEDEDEKVKFKIKALTDAESGMYMIPVKIIYFDESKEKHEKDSLISITVNVEPLLGVEIEDGLFLKGQNNEVVVKIINKGLSNVRFLEIELGGSRYANLLSSNSIYLGELSSDDFETADFRIFFKENTPTIVNIPVTLIYKDITNKEYTEDFTVSLKTYTRERAIELGLLKRNNTAFIVTTIIVVLVVYIVYRKIKKKKMRKKAEGK